MPLRCFDPLGNCHLHAFDVSADDWQILAARNRRDRHLRMPCCAALVTLRRSRRGTQFFAHKSIATCTTAPETEAHLRLKHLAVEAARARGWTAETEVSGTTPSGESWKADVLACKGNGRVAVEIQWSAQTHDETMRRQTRYAASGVRGLWLMRHPGLPATEALPAALISGSAEIGFTAVLKAESGDQILPMEEFLAAAFSGRLQFGIPLGARGRMRVSAGRLACWSCGAETQVISEICVLVGPEEYRFTVPDFDKYPALLQPVLRHLPNHWQVGETKRRYSKGQGRSYLSNGCMHCDALIGQFLEHNAWSDGQETCELGVAIDDQWLAAIRERGYKETWIVYPVT